MGGEKNIVGIKRNIDGIDSSGRRGSSRIGSIGGILSSTWNNCDGIDECATWVKKGRREKREKGSEHC